MLAGCDVAAALPLCQPEGVVGCIWTFDSMGHRVLVQELPELISAVVLSLQFQMTFHLFIAAFVGAAITLVALVSLSFKS